MAVKIEHCTSCGSDQIEVAGNKYLCRICNVVYEVTDTGTKALETDPLGKDRERIDRAEKDIAAIKEKLSKPEPDKNENENENDDEEQDGFLIWQDE